MKFCVIQQSFQAAEKFELKRLQDLVMKNISTRINSSNVLQIYRYCTSSSQKNNNFPTPTPSFIEKLTPLKRYCEYACAVIVDSLSKNEEFESLDEKQKKEIEFWRESGTKLKSYTYTYCKEVEMVKFSKDSIPIVCL